MKSYQYLGISSNLLLMKEAESNQSFDTCRSAVMAGGDDEWAWELRDHGMYEVYGCMNHQVVDLKLFGSPHEIIDFDGSRLQIRRFNTWDYGPSLNDSPEQVQGKLDKALAFCRTCPFYQPKTKK